MARLSIKRFAEEIGLSVGTVSAALNGLPSVKTETAEYVRRMALERGYALNRWAQKMQGRASRLFALVLPRRPTNLTHRLTQEILDVLRREGFAATVYYVSGAEEIDLYRAPVDGFILVSSGFPRLRAALETTDIPYLVIDPPEAEADRGRPGYGPAILLDRHAAARDAAELLQRAGCRRLLFGGTPAGPKYDGFVEGVGDGLGPVVTVDPATGETPDGRHLRDVVRPTTTGPPGIWVAGLRDMASLVRVCDRSGLEIGRDLYSLYWGSHFHELPGFENLSYIGEPGTAFLQIVIEWARGPRNPMSETVRIRLEARIRRSMVPASSSATASPHGDGETFRCPVGT